MIVAAHQDPKEDSHPMKLWRLSREPHVALDGAGAEKFGGRYSSAGRPVVSLASEAGLAVLVALRYLLPDRLDAESDHLLGWTSVDAVPERIADDLPRPAIIACVDEWLDTRRSLLAAIRSKVLPEADVILMNPRHPEAERVPPLVTRPFSFAECLHRPPMLDVYRCR
ncbi:RES family NAD+ phosphorylase [Sphingopyxis lindanitolerans]|nr:RES family NAD+ phosphorylase [Sphingopyxis lindanitolerans]